MALGLFAKLLANPEGLKVAGKAAKYTGIGLGVGGFGIYHMITGKGLVDVAGNTVLGEEYEKQGLAGVIKKKATGEAGQDKGLAEGLVDTSLGDGTYQKMGDTAGEVVDSVGTGIKKVKDTAVNVVGAGVDMVQGGVQNMMGNGQQQQYVDPNTGYYPQQTMMNGGVNQFTAPFNSIPQMIGNMTGSNVTMTNLAGLIASAYMMMGPFGWLGKIASLLTGNMALKSMRQQPQVAYVPQQGYYPQQQPYQPAMTPPQQQQDDDNAVFRSRRM